MRPLHLFTFPFAHLSGRDYTINLSREYCIKQFRNEC